MHVSMSQVMEGDYVPNDVALGVGLAAPGQCQVLTGPNMVSMEAGWIVCVCRGV